MFCTIGQQRGKLWRKSLFIRCKQLSSLPGRLPDRYESNIGIYVNPVGPNVNVKNVKVQGPGLPVAGLVLTASTACGPLPNGKLDYMSIANKTGDTSVSSTPWATSNFHLANVDTSGQQLAWSDNASRAQPQISDFSVILPFALYTFTFTLNDLSTVAYKKRLLDPVLSPNVARSMQWNDFTADTMKYLDPANSLAGAAATIPVSWTQNVNAELITNIRVYSGNAAGAVDGKAYVTPAKATSVNVSAPASCGSGTSASVFAPLTADGTSYRGIQQSYRRAVGIGKGYQAAYN